MLKSYLMSTKNLIILFGLFLSFHFVSTAWAGQIWPIATGVDVEVISSTSATYTIHMEYVNLNLSEEELADKPCKDLCAFNLYHRHNGPSSSYKPTIRNQGVSGIPSFDANDSWKVILNRMSNKPVSTTVSVGHTGSPNGNECVGAGLDSNLFTEVTVDNLYKVFIQPPGIGTTATCLGTPPANEWCSLTTPQIDINYGRMSLKDAEGATKKENINVECTTGMKYALRLRGKNNIDLSNGMKAVITANGKDLGESLDGETGSNNVEIASTLKGTPETSGAFSGNGVLFVSYP